MDGIEPYEMREACRGCGCKYGRITETGAQDVVRCADCNHFCYNAPRVETGKRVRTVQTTHAQIKPRDRALIIERANGRCEFCGRSGKDSVGGLHVAHIISVESGLRLGMADADINSGHNLAAACAECNLGWGKRTIPLHFAVRIVMARMLENNDEL